MDTQSLYALSPLDGRYRQATSLLSHYFSEAALINQRLELELLYLEFLSKEKIIRKLSKKELAFLESLKKLDTKALLRIKKIESKTHHDIKAIEYFLQEKFAKNSLKDLIPFIHFALTSEDINNLAWRVLLRKTQAEILLPQLLKLLATLNLLIIEHKATPMLARTHGQAALPSTFGKELAVFANRLLKQIKLLANFKFSGKLGGAIGSYNSFVFAKEKYNWIQFSKKFVKALELEHELCTTQVNPNDDLSEFFSIYLRINSILIDFSQDMWRYISDAWLIQKHEKDQVGSSTMPQKINPINFENAEGNLELANALLEFFIRKLPISRLQRDLSDSTVLRNMGVSLAHSYLSYENLTKALPKLSANKEQMLQDLNRNWNILAEAMNIDSRLQADTKAYQKAMKQMKGKVINKKLWQAINKTASDRLQTLSPTSYMGFSEKIAKEVSKEVNKYLGKA